jgi:transcriptional antiterminator NusG
VPVSDSEIAAILKNISEDNKTIITDYEVGDQVKIIDGTFKNSDAKIISIDSEKSESILELEFFGKKTEINIPLAQIKKI